MGNLTITVEEEVLKRARIRELQQGTSVNAVLRAYLEAYAGLREDQQAALQRLLEMSNATQSGRGDAVWTRDDLHERG
jgi:molybdenum-dependent DNA-binding transcriptional regulator ModE